MTFDRYAARERHSDTRSMRDAAEADPYAAVCILAQRRQWKVMLAIEVGDPPKRDSRLSRLSLMDSRGDVRGLVKIDGTLERAAYVLLSQLAQTEKDSQRGGD